MAAVARTVYITPEEYLRLERDADFRSEYWDGVIVAMAGGSPEHEYIADNVRGALYTQIRGSRCRSFGSASVHIPRYNRYVYPDATVACSPEFTRINGVGVLTNPVLVAEVLSQSKAHVDLTLKKEGYASIESLIYYMVVSQDLPRVELFVRQPDGSLQITSTVIGLEGSVSLPDIVCQLSMSEIYRDVEFAPVS